MEHRLILGGEQYLPFARSCVVKLKKLGLPYANQSFEIDGISINVRIEPGHEYIRLEGGGDIFKMDSGAVAVTYLAPGSPTRAFPGYLFDCGPAVSYHANFTAALKGLGRTKETKGSEGQFAGDLSKVSERFKGRIVYDKDMAAAFPSPISGVSIPANCLSPAWESSIDPVTGVEAKTPVGFSVDEDDFGDNELLLKKFIMARCPASIFTGKTRLYVQAMYGLPLYEYSSLADGGPRKPDSPPKVNRPIVGVSQPGGAAPLLKVLAYVAKDDFRTNEAGELTSELNGYPDVTISTSHGVRLDPETGKHFLISVGSDLVTTGVTITPLVGPKGIEALRKKLITGGEKTPKNPLSEEDRNHLEAYVLARCLPDVKHTVSLPAMGPSGGFSMGYGWHWNWSGTKADIVTNETNTFAWSPTKAHMRSAHFRVEVSTDPENLPSSTANLTVVTGLTDWYVEREWFPIVEPDYSVDFLSKTTPRQTWAIDNVKAPFYAFYRGDELVVCTIENKLHPASGSRVMSPGFASSPVYGVADILYSIGYNATGYLTDTSTTEHRTTTFKVGQLSTGELNLSRVDTKREYRAGNTDLGIEGGPRWNDEPGFSGTHYYTGGQFTIPSYEPVRYNNGYYSLFSWYREYWDATEYYTSQAEVVVPFFDSQAIYLDWWTQKTANFSGYIRNENQSSNNFYAGWLSRTYYWDFYTGAKIGPFDSTRSGGMPNLNNDIVITTPKPSEITIERERKLVCVAGVIDHEEVTTGHQFFHANLEDYVESQFDTRSGTSTTQPTVVAAQTGVKVGSDIPWFASTVGWV